MNAKFAYPMALAAFLAFGATTLSLAHAQDSEQQPQQEEQTQPQTDGGSSGSSE